MTLGGLPPCIPPEGPGGDVGATATRTMPSWRQAVGVIGACCTPPGGTYS